MITKISTKDMTRDQWLAIRANSIGGSEVGSIMGMNPYECVQEVWARKVGLESIEDKDNWQMFMGRELESFIADLWQYIELDDLGQIDFAKFKKNYETKKVIQKCRRLNAVLYHPKYPFMSANIDREIVGKKAILELKLISGWVMAEWEAGIPPSYVLQLQHYLNVTGYDRGEILLLKDGKFPVLYKFEREQEVIDKIETTLLEFWGRVTATKEAIARGENPYAYEPPPDGSVAFEKYLAKKHKGNAIVQGDLGLLDKAKHIQSAKEEVKSIQEEMRLSENILKNFMEKQKASEIDFGFAGRVTWNEDKNGKKYLKVKVN